MSAMTTIRRPSRRGHLRKLGRVPWLLSISLLIEAVERFGFPRSTGFVGAFLQRTAMAAQRRKPVESIQVSVPGMASQNPSICGGGGHHHGMSGHCRTLQAVVYNRHNFQRTGPPARLMYYCSGSWVDFPSRVVESLRPSFVQRRPLVDLAIDGSWCVFDFHRMLQTEFETGNQRSIAWMDDAGSCFFPRSFIEELGECSLKRKREERKEEEDEDEDEEEVSSSNDKQEAELKRRCLVSSRSNPEKSLWANAILLEEGARSYLRIKNYFLSALKNTSFSATVTGIHQCKWGGDLGLARLEVFKRAADIIKAERGASNTMYAWHGTSKEGVDSILAHGFPSPINITESGNYGVGVYFSSMGLPHLR